MNGHGLKLLGAACIYSLTIISQPATAAVMYDQYVTGNVIMGSGITNGSWTVDRANNVELGLRGKLRFNPAGVAENTFNSNGDGTYSFAAGVAPTQSFPKAVWSFEWSINSDYHGDPGGNNLADLTYQLGYDSDPGTGTAWSIFDPINVAYADHSIGDNLTTESAGTEAADAAGYVTLIGANNLAQNSWQAHWILAGFDPTVDGQYDFFLAALNGTGGQQLARTDMSIIVGAGASVVPVPAAVWLFGTALVGFAGLSRRKKAV